MKQLFTDKNGGLVEGKKLKLLIFMVCLAMISLTTVAYAITGSVKLSKNSVHNSTGLINAEGNNIHAVYEQSADWISTTSSVYYKKKTIDSDTWSSPVKIATGAQGTSNENYYWRYSDFPDSKTDLAMTSYNGKAFVTYVINDGDHEIAFKSNRSGSWPTEPIKLTNDTGWHQFQPSMAQYKGRLYVVFVKRKNWTFNNSEIYFMKNVDGKWTEPIALTTNSINDDQPYIYAKGGKVYVVWLSHGYVPKVGYTSSIKYKYLYKGRWSGEHTVATSSKENYSNPSIAVSSKAYVAYTKTYGWYSTNIGLSYYESGGWKASTLTSNPSSDVSNHSPRIANLGSKMGIIWSRTVGDSGYYGSGSSSSDVWYAYRDSDSVGWKRENITNTPYSNEHRNDITLDSQGNRHLLFTGDEDGDNDIYYIKK